jgi:FMN phosphatase YigB (HAD superfamily)
VNTSTVFLDAGGVLVDESTQEQMRAEVMVETLAAVVPGYDLERYWADVDHAVGGHVTDVYGYVLERNVPNNDRLLEKLRVRYSDLYETKRPPLQLARGILGQMAQIRQEFRIGYAGQYGHELFHLLEAHNVLHEFCVARTEKELGAAKPDPEYYRRLAAAAGVEPSECVMVGDRIDKDIAPSKAVGMKTVRLRVGLHRNQPVRSPEERADIEISTLDNLAEALNEIA